MAFEITEEEKARIENLRSTAFDNMRREVEQFYSDVDWMIEKNNKHHTIFDKVGAVTGSAMKHMLDGGLGSIPDVLQTVNVIGSQFVNDVAHIFDKDDGTGAWQDTKYAGANLALNLGETLLQGIVSTTANLGRIAHKANELKAGAFEALGSDKLARQQRERNEKYDPKWAFGEDGAIEKYSTFADMLRNVAMGDTMEEATRNTEEDIEDRYYEKTQEWLRGSVGVHNWVDKNIVENVSDTLTAGSAQRADEMFVDSKFYEQAMGVSESMGNILAVWGVSKIVKTAMPKASPEQVSAISQSYFASSVFADMYQDAVNSGSDLNEAFTYATGQAMMETLLEQTGGFKVTDGADSLKVWNRLQKKGFSGVLQDAMEEGLEEVGAEYAGTGYGSFLNEGIEEKSDKQFYSDVMFAFLAGSASSLGLGAARSSYFNMTADGKAEKLYNNLRKETPEKANKDLQVIAKSLNNEAVGVAVNEKGTSTTKKMNQEEKRKFIERNQLEELITEDDNGNFIAQEITEDTFKNKIGENVIDDSKYAINENVRGVDISDGGKTQVVEKAKATKVGKKALDIADKIDAPIALYRDNSENTGYYGKNGVVYINENNLDNYNVEKTIIKHEMIHAIRSTDEQLYKNIKNSVSDFVTIKVGENNNIEFKYKNETIKDIFREQGIESRIEQSAREDLKSTNDANIAMDTAQEETVAYFMQNVIDDGALMDMLSKDKKNKSVLKKILDKFSSNDVIDKRFQDGRVGRKMKEIKRAFERGVNKTVENKRSVGYVIREKRRQRLEKEFKEKIAKADAETKKKLKELQTNIVSASQEYAKAVDPVNFEDSYDGDLETALENERKNLSQVDSKKHQSEFVTLLANTITMHEQQMEDNDGQDPAQAEYDKFQETVDEWNEFDPSKTMEENMSKQQNTKKQKTLKDVKANFEQYMNLRKNLVESIQKFMEGIGDYEFIDTYDGSYMAENLEQELKRVVNEKDDTELIQMIEGTQREREQFIEDNSEKDFEELGYKQDYDAFQEALNEYNAFEPRVDEYEMLLEDTSNVSIYEPTKKQKKAQPKQKDTAELTEAQKETMTKITENPLYQEFFDVNKKGEMVLKSDKITNQKFKNTSIIIDGKTYKSSEYAINTYNDLSKENINFFDTFKPVKLSELTNHQLAMHKFFQNTKLNYVLYSEKSKTIGFSKSLSGVNLIYLNIQNIAFDSRKWADTLIHEHVHEAFKFNKQAGLDYIYAVADTLFEPIYDKAGRVDDIRPTWVWMKFNEKFANGFHAYFNHNYKKGHTKLPDTLLETYKLLKHAKDRNITANQYSTFNEVAAQITGFMMSSESIYKKLLGSNPKLTVKMHQIYDSMMKDPNLDPTTKQYLKTMLSEYDKLFNQYMETMEKKFPTRKKYTLKTLNKFIKEFTDGEFTTKSALLQQYFKEKKQKTSGDASITVDNIIYVASKMQEVMQKSTEKYTEIVNEFKDFKENIQNMIRKPDEVLLVDEVSKDVRKLKNTVSKIFGTLNGKTYVKPIVVDQYTMTKLQEKLDMVEETYQGISDQVLKMFGMPSQMEMHTTFNYIEKIIANFQNEMAYRNQVSEGMRDSMQDQFDLFKVAIEDVLNVNKDNGKIPHGIKNMQKDLRNHENKALVNAIHRALKNVNDGIANLQRANQAPQNDDFNAMYNYINEIVEVVKANKMDYAKMQKEVLPILNKMFNKIITSKQVGMEVEADYKGIEKETREQVDKEVLEKRNNLIDTTLREIYEQFAVLFDDVNFVQNIYSSETKYTFVHDQGMKLTDAVGQFNENKIAKNLVTILDSFKTVYTSVFSEQGHSLGAYSMKIFNQMQKLESDGKEFNFKLLTRYISSGMPPQDILLAYTASVGDDLSFFKDFSREYLKANSKMEQVIATFDRASTRWHEAHENAKENSLEEIEINPSYLVKMRDADIKIINKQAKDKIKAIRDKIKPLQKTKKDLAVNRKDINISIQDQALLKRKAKTKKQWLKADVQMKQLEKDKKDIIKQEKAIKKDIDALKREISLYDKRLLMQKEIAKHADKQRKSKKKQTIKKGNIISLYLSIKREIEMHEMAENGDATIRPTDHFAFGNQIEVMDNQLMEQKGYDKAMQKVEKFTIFTHDRQELVNYLEQFLTEEDRQSIAFARDTFDTNYNFLNEMYKAKYQVDLARQKTYIPFSTANASKDREAKLKRINRTNIGFDRSMTMEMTIGASEALTIENIFSVTDSYTRSVSRYSFDRLATDYQNLLINKAGGAPLQSQMRGEGNVFGENQIENHINKMFKDILGYTDVYEQSWVKLAVKVIRNTVRAIIALAVPMTIKQFISTNTIQRKQRAKMDDPERLNLMEIVKETAKTGKLSEAKILSMFKQDAEFQYLMEHSNNFYLRAKYNFIPNLAQSAPVQIFGQQSKSMRKVMDKLDKMNKAMTSHVGFADARVIVGAFKAKTERIMKNNKNMTKDQAREKAVEWLESEVFIYSVANTSPALRSNLSNTRNPIAMIAGIFQSENLLHYGSFIRNIVIAQNQGFKKQMPMFTRDLSAYLMSGLLSAFIDMWWAKRLGFYEAPEGKGTREFIVNDFVWGNLVGAVPYVNQISSLMEFDFDVTENHPLGVGMDTGFPARIPFVGEMENVFKDAQYIMDKDGNVDPRAIYRSIEEVGYMLGIPIKNARKISTVLASYMADTGNETGIQLDRFMQNETKSKAYYRAVREGNEKVMNSYINDVFNNVDIQNEILRLNHAEGVEDPIKIFDVDTFRKLQDDGTYKNVKIPQKTNDKYKALTQRALTKTLRKISYRKLPDMRKAKTIQRVINYYYNYMKEVVLNDYDKISDMDKVVERAINQAYIQMEKEKA